MHDMYDRARQDFGLQQLNWITCNPRLWLVTNGYAPVLTHATLADVPNGARILSSLALANLSMDRGIARADPITIGNEFAGRQVAGAVLYSSTGTDNTSRLLAFYSDVLGLPSIIPAAGAVWTWDATYGLFQV